MNGNTIKRGSFIVFEGCDRCGKSTQSRMLYEFLLKQGFAAKYMAFPERSTKIGNTINAYLTNQQQICDETVHLLFTANRWEFQKQIKQSLLEGTTIVADRYSYSGVAYSSAKGLSYDWCMAPERGLIRPDLVFYLRNEAIETLLRRVNFGSERYENRDLQMKVAKIFDHIYQQERPYWHLINADLSKVEIHQQIIEQAQYIIDYSAYKDLDFL